MGSLGRCVVIVVNIVVLSCQLDIMSNQIRVRVNCSSMNNIRGGQKRKKEKEQEWDSWVKEKSQRIAKLHKIQKKMNREVGVEGVTQKHLEQNKMGRDGDLVVSVIDGLKNKDGYSRLEDIPSQSGSLTDLREVQQTTNQSCCSCCLM